MDAKVTTLKASKLEKEKFIEEFQEVRTTLSSQVIKAEETLRKEGKTHENTLMTVKKEFVESIEKCVKVIYMTLSRIPLTR